MREDAKRILFEASCGYGKSVVIQIIAEAYAKTGKRVRILCNRTAVIKQLRARFNGNPLIEVMTVQTADSRRDLLSDVAITLIDEFHMGGSGAQYGRVIESSPDAIVIGFTGTPRPESFDVLPAHVEGHDAAWLTDQGFLSPLKYFCPNRVDLRRARKSNGDYVDADVIAEIEAKDVCGDAIKSYREGCVGRPTLIFCQNKKHAWSVHDEFEAAGIETRVLLGGDKDDDEKLKWVADGGPLIVVDRVSAGFDLPELHAIIVLRATSSPHLWVQILGRPARAADGKLAGYVFDHVGNTMRCGTLTEARDWRNGGDIGDDAKTEDGDRLSVRRCEDCFFVWEGVGCICPECGSDNGQDLRISLKKAVEIREQSAAEIEEKRRQAGLMAKQDRDRKKQEAEEEKARRAEQRKHLGMGIRQRTAMLRQKRVKDPFKTAVDQMRARLDRAVRVGDEVAERFATGELRAAGIQIDSKGDDILKLIEGLAS